MKRSGSISGGISLVMIFCVLCMTVFAALTMVTAQREHDMARLTAQRAEEANEADRIAAETVAALARGERPQGVTLAGVLLDEAAPHLPLAIEDRSTEMGRITRPAALGIKAVVLVMMLAGVALLLGGSA